MPFGVPGGVVVSVAETSMLPPVADRMDAAVLATMRDGVITVDRGGTIRTINPQAERSLGLRASECVGQKFGVVVFQRRDLDRFGDVVIAAIADPLTSHTEEFKVKDAGGTRHFGLKTSALVDPDTGAVAGVVALINETTEQVQALRDRIEFGYLSICTMIFMSLGSLAGVASFSLAVLRAPGVTWPLLLLMTATTLLLLRTFQIPLAAVGLTRRNLRISIIEGIWFSALAFVAIVAIAVAVRVGNGEVLPFNPFIDSEHFRLALLLYLPHAFMQELVSRGFLQGSFKRLMADRTGVPSIVAASVAFGVLHSQLGLAAIVLTFVSGLVFGWIYNRHENLAGVTICHIVAGTVAFSTGLLHH